MVHETRDVLDVKFARFRIPDVPGYCLPDSEAGYRIQISEKLKD